jgi:hypothetical protein
MSARRLAYKHCLHPDDIDTLLAYVCFGEE